MLRALSQPDAIEKMCVASGGYDLPCYEKLTTLKVWQEEGPPKGTLYHYPNPHNHHILSIAAAPAPPKIAQQIYTQATLTKMCLRYHKGEAMEKVSPGLKASAKASCGADGRGIYGGLPDRRPPFPIFLQSRARRNVTGMKTHHG